MDALPLHALTVSLTQSKRLFTMLQYNTIPYPAVLQCFYFIGEIPWENTTVNPIPWVRKIVGQQTYQNILLGATPPNPKVGEQVYSTPGVQT